MKRFLALLALLIVTAAPSFAATTWEVNGTAGAIGPFLAAGDDTNGNGTFNTPYATVQKAFSVAVAGDTIDCATATYTLDSIPASTGYLDINKVITIQTNSTTLASTGKATLKGAGTTRVINANTSSLVTLTNLIIDCESGASKNALTNCRNVSAFGLDFKGIASTNQAFNTGLSPTLVAEKCTMTSTNTNSNQSKFLSIFQSGGSYTIKGCTTNGIGSTVTNGAHVTVTLLRMTQASDGTRNTVSGITNDVVYYPNGAALTTVDIEYTDFSGTLGTRNSIIGGDANSTENVANLTIKYCTIAAGANTAIYCRGTYTSVEVAYNSFTGSSYFVRAWNPLISSISVHNNTVTQTSATADPISISYAVTVSVYANNITTDNQTHAILVGVDGQPSIQSSTTDSATIEFGKTSSEAYFYQPITTGTISFSRIPSSFRIKMKAQGSPTGTVTGYFYSNSAGVPGSVLVTSDFSLPASVLTSTATWYEFWLPTHVSIADSTTYHLVLKYTGPYDGTNYIQVISAASGTTSGYSSDGVTWNAGAGSALYQLMDASFEIVDPLVYGNTVTCSTATSTGLHDIIIGGTIGAQMYRNLTFGGSISIIDKLVDGSQNGHPALMYDNLCYQSNSTNASRQLCRSKGSRNLSIYQNTFVATGNGTSNVIQIDSDYESGAGLTPQYNGQPSQNVTFENNIVYGASGTTGASKPYLYLLGGPTTVNLGDSFVRYTNVTIDHNCVYGDGTFTIMGNYPTASGNDYTYAQMQTAGFDVNGVNFNPGLPAETTAPSSPLGFRPPSASLSNGIGIDLTSTVPTDYYGVNFLATGPDAGGLNALRRTGVNHSISAQRTIVNHAISGTRTIIR